MISNYYKPTPKKWRIIGDTFLAISTAVTGGGLLAFDQMKDVFGESTLKWIIGGAFIIGVLGKFLTNLFKERNEEAK